MTTAPPPPPRSASPAAASPEGVRAAALRLVEPLPPGRALDVPCGTGLIGEALASRGWRMVGADRDPTAARARGLEAVAADMERPLPFPDRAFDLALCVEGIEHVEGQAALLHELARVLVPGGHLVLTTPNVLGRPSRETLWRHGYARFFRPSPAGARTPYEHEHVHPIDVLRLEHLARAAGLEPEAYDCERGPDGGPGWRRRWLRRLAAPRMRRHNPRADLLLAPPVFHGRVLAMRARKR